MKLSDFLLKTNRWQFVVFYSVCQGFDHFWSEYHFLRQLRAVAKICSNLKPNKLKYIWLSKGLSKSVNEGIVVTELFSNNLIFAERGHAISQQFFTTMRTNILIRIMSYLSIRKRSKDSLREKTNVWVGQNPILSIDNGINRGFGIMSGLSHSLSFFLVQMLN